MSSRNFKSLNRAYRRGHLKVQSNGIGGLSILRKVKSLKSWHRKWIGI